MKATIEYLEELKEKQKLISDYAVSKYLKVTPQHVHTWRTRSVPDDLICTKIAEGLGINPFEIISAANAERAERAGAKGKAQFWKVRWEHTRQHTATVLLGSTIALLSVMQSTNFVYPVIDIRRKRTKKDQWYKDLRALATNGKSGKIDTETLYALRW